MPELRSQISGPVTAMPVPLARRVTAVLLLAVAGSAAALLGAVALFILYWAWSALGMIL